MASIYWLLGSGRANISTYAGISRYFHDPKTDTYNVTSTLRYSLNRTHTGKFLTCGTRNEATSLNEGGVETSTILDVKCKLRRKSYTIFKRQKNKTVTSMNKLVKLYNGSYISVYFPNKDA